MRDGRGRVLAGLVVLLGIASGPGCLSTTMDARYVYQDGEYGVIGVPRNSSYGKKDYRQQARELMTLHFPEGYEIVRAEEIVAGERVTDTARKVEVETEPGVNALNQMLKVGKFEKSTSLDQKDTLQITESRIIYRRKGARTPAVTDGFAEVATAVPNLYIDPNDTVRKLGATTLLAAQKKAEDTKPDAAKVTVATKTTVDPGVQKSSGDPPK
ncbi:hypothetical protein TA3x_002619 [Tundrisphaera sp. TA3]|uniref:hypothetical protein n=1 Tax=Tundrisphaera sp. TA3 TaxID=3435775 RepID=UPI003EC0C38A